MIKKTQSGAGKRRKIYEQAKSRGKASALGRIVQRIAELHPSPTVRAVGYVLAFLLLVSIGNFFQNASFGTSLIVIYGVIALIFRIKSDETFKMALVTLLYVIVLTIMRNRLLADNFAQYAFLLLGIGAISVLFEQQRSLKKK